MVEVPLMESFLPVKFQGEGFSFGGSFPSQAPGIKKPIVPSVPTVEI